MDKIFDLFGKRCDSELLSLLRRIVEYRHGTAQETRCVIGLTAWILGAAALLPFYVQNKVYE